jgi:hypothetical protein
LSLKVPHIADAVLCLSLKAIQHGCMPLAHWEMSSTVPTLKTKYGLATLAELLFVLHLHHLTAVCTGVPAEHVHRLLLGLSLDCDDLRPWLGLAGCCTAALKAAAGESVHEVLLVGGWGGSCTSFRPQQLVQNHTACRHAAMQPCNHKPSG